MGQKAQRFSFGGGTEAVSVCEPGIQPPYTRKRAFYSGAPYGVILSLLIFGGCGGFAARGRNAEGVRLFLHGQYQEAIAEFHKAINADPANPDSYYNLAATYHRLGTMHRNPAELSQAEHYYLMCRDRDPHHAECYRGLAVLMVQQGRTQEAFRMLKDWADREPFSVEPRIELARLSEEFGDKKTAKEYLLAALALDPNHPRVLTALGNLREQMGETGLALENYERALAQNPFQSELAARVAALRAGLRPAGGNAPGSFPSGGTGIASGSSSLRR